MSSGSLLPWARALLLGGSTHGAEIDLDRPDAGRGWEFLARVAHCVDPASHAASKESRAGACLGVLTRWIPVERIGAALEAEDTDHHILCLLAEVAFVRMDKDSRAKHVQTLRRMDGDTARRDLQRVVEAAARQNGVREDAQLSRVEARLREACDLLEHQAQKTAEMQDRAALADEYKRRADDAERELANVSDLRKSEEALLRDTLEQCDRLRTRLDIAQARVEEVEHSQEVRESSSASKLAMEKEVMALRSKNAALQSELTLLSTSTSARRTTRRTSASSPSRPSAAAAAAQAEALVRLEADNQALRLALEESHAEHDELCELRLSCTAWQQRVDQMSARARALEQSLQAREERAAREKEIAAKALATAQNEVASALRGWGNYFERVCEAETALAKMRQKRAAATTIAHWWRIMRVERDAYARSSELTKQIKARVKSEMQALERRVEEGVALQARLRREKAQLQSKVDELGLKSVDHRNVESLANEIRDLVQQLERANAELAELRERPAILPSSSTAAAAGAAAGAPAPEAMGRVVREYETRLARLEAELTSEHLRLTKESARRMELEAEVHALKKSAEEVQADLIRERLKTARHPLAPISSNAGAGGVNGTPKVSNSRKSANKDEEFSNRIPETSELMVNNVPSAAVAGIPRRSFFRPSSVTVVNKPTIKSPPVSIREEGQEGGECAQQ